MGEVSVVEVVGEGQILTSTRECPTAFRIDTLLPLFERVLKKADLPKR